MYKHLSSRAKVICLSFSSSLDTQPKKKVYQKSVAAGFLTSVRSGVNGEPCALFLLRFYSLLCVTVVLVSCHEH